MDASRSSHDRTAPQILLVEDEPKLRDTVAEGLRIENWEVMTAATGTEAFELVRTHDFDLLILDWMLPDVDGLEVLQRARVRWPQVPVIMITARCSHSDQVEALQSGVTDYLMKPFSFYDLLTRCQALLTPARRA